MILQDNQVSSVSILGVFVLVVVTAKGGLCCSSFDRVEVVPRTVPEFSEVNKPRIRWCNLKPELFQCSIDTFETQTNRAMASIQQRQRNFIQRFSSVAILNQICCLLSLLLPFGTRAFLTTSTRRHSNNNGYAAILPHMTTKCDGESIAYLVEPVSRTANEKVFTEIAEMCIDVFFKESLGAKPGDKIA